MGFWDTLKEAWAETDPSKKRQVKVMTFKGDKAASRGIEKMLNEGWEVENADSRRQVASMHKGAALLFPVAGLFTSKQKHTITFVKEPRSD